MRIDGQVITALGPDPAPEPAGAQVIDARGGLALPGFVSAHQHLPTHLLASPSSRAVYSGERLEDLAVLSSRLVCAHCTCADDGDIARLAAYDVKVAHCPSSNAFGGVVAPIRAFLEAGLTVGLGSDNASLNRNSDILAEARRGVLTARVQGAHRVLRLDTHIGSLLPGKKADLIVVDTDGPHWWPRHDWFESLVFEGKSSDVRTVVIDGAVVLADRQLTALDLDSEAALCLRAQVSSLRILNRAGLALRMRAAMVSAANRACQVRAICRVRAARTGVAAEMRAL